jgi:hypothetical protein
MMLRIQVRKKFKLSNLTLNLRSKTVSVTEQVIIYIFYNRTFGISDMHITIKISDIASNWALYNTNIIFKK